MITLPAHPAHDLDWDIDSATETVWHLDFGWDRLDPFDEALLNANLLAVEEFVKKVPTAKEVVLAKLDGDFASLLTPSPALDSCLEESPLPKDVFLAQITSDYLHRLASVLPDEMTPVILIELKKELNLASAILSFCRRRFEHFSLQFLTSPLPIEGEAPFMISLPSDDRFDPDTLEALMNSMQEKTFKCVPEELLNEHWEGVDTLIIDPTTLGDIGKRMIEGFEAAGGEVIRSRGI